jgi:5S rRNA maturation endonuclease (ribonuclease M5)
MDGDALSEFLDSIDSLVIVEGESDMRALTSLGVDPELIVVLNKGASLAETVEAISEARRAVILTDMDGEGKRLRKKLLGLFQIYGMEEDALPRQLYARLRMSHVEGLKL